MENEQVKKPNKWMKEIKEIVVTFLIAFVVIKLITMFLVIPIKIVGDSMIPNYHNNEIGIANRLAARLGHIDYNDVVVANDHQDGFYIIKRVVALPGDTVEMIDGDVFVNGIKRDDSFVNQYTNEIKNDPYADYPKTTLTDNQYFLLGDNRPYSKDSRELGAFDQEDIFAVSGVIIFPFNKIKVME